MHSFATSPGLVLIYTLQAFLHTASQCPVFLVILARIMKFSQTFRLLCLGSPAGLGLPWSTVLRKNGEKPKTKQRLLPSKKWVPFLFFFFSMQRDGCSQDFGSHNIFHSIMPLHGWDYPWSKAGGENKRIAVFPTYTLQFTEFIFCSFYQKNWVSFVSFCFPYPSCSSLFQHMFE